MRKMLILLLVVGIFLGTCAFQVAAESIYEENISFVSDMGLIGHSFRDHVPCGGEGDGGGGTPG